MKSVRKNQPEPKPLLASDAPNVITLVRMCGRWFALKCIDGEVAAKRMR